MPDRPIDNLLRLAPAEIQQLAFGVRYEPQYRVMDRIGTVIDEILRADGTPFGPETFPMTTATPQQYRLLEPETDVQDDQSENCIGYGSIGSRCSPGLLLVSPLGLLDGSYPSFIR
jgi:hypothetical protein